MLISVLCYNIAMQDSIFTKIIRGEIPCHKIYEDKLTLAFLTINPIQPGHTLVIPKRQVNHLWDLELEDYYAVMDTSKKVALHIRKILQPKRVAMQVAGVEVPHAHVHLFPFNTLEEFHAHASKEEPDHTALAVMAERLRLPDNQ
jgi:histidine triad (HIT) family protein